MIIIEQLIKDTIIAELRKQSDERGYFIREDDVTVAPGRTYTVDGSYNFMLVAAKVSAAIQDAMIRGTKNGS